MLIAKHLIFEYLAKKLTCLTIGIYCTNTVLLYTQISVIRNSANKNRDTIGLLPYKELSSKTCRIVRYGAHTFCVTPMHFVWHFTQFVWVMLFVWGSGPMYFVWGFQLRNGT